MTTTRHPAIVKALNLALTETGCTKEQAIQQAMDSVLGDGTYQEIADSTWEMLQPA